MEPPPSPSSISRVSSPLSLVLIGLAAGIVGSFFGLGGGVVFVPLFTLFLRRPIHQSTVTSLAAMQVIALVSILTYEFQAHLHGQELVRWSMVWLLAPAAVLGSSLLGIPLGRRLRGQSLRRIFGLALLLVASRMLGWFGAGSPPSESAPWPLWVAGPCGVLMGMASGLLGVGGGFLAVPMLALGFQLDQHNAHATSLVIVLAASVAGTLRAQQGDDPERKPDWNVALHVAPGAIAGAIAGSMLAAAVPPGSLRSAFAVVLSVFALQMLGLGQAIAAGARLIRSRLRGGRVSD
ncbi:MAG: sulfite exporter TauE/SafE family protein [Armatimonadota bacterium]|nr:sulfite exporter TauE/SafE family protein [candidate division WS1 bacterium]